jgi:Gas vesicle protein
MPARERGMNSRPEQRIASAIHTTNLADILERVLDKGIVIAGDITISLAEIELLSIKIRLLVASVDKAKEMGINWWESDPSLSSQAKRLEEENTTLRARLDRLEAGMAAQAASVS